MSGDPKAPPLWGRILMAFGAGGLVGCYLLMIGYINRDAGRRGMNRIVWTAIALLVPNALGIILYFLLRQSLSAICTHCGGRVQYGYCFCPHCGENLAPQCPHCQHAIHAGDVFCPYCGREVKSDKTGPGQQQTELEPQT
jgi:predicted amidophosphoribosyltransferase